jgi:hypothetical protein
LLSLPVLAISEKIETCLARIFSSSLRFRISASQGVRLNWRIRSGKVWRIRKVALKRMDLCILYICGENWVSLAVTDVYLSELIRIFNASASRKKVDLVVQPLFKVK